MFKKENNAGSLIIKTAFVIAVIVVVFTVFMLLKKRAGGNDPQVKTEAGQEAGTEATTSEAGQEAGTEATTSEAVQEAGTETTASEAAQEDAEDADTYLEALKSMNADSLLTLWSDAAQSRQQLVSYVEAATREDGADFIPVEQRVAVFDLDGTIFCETDPCRFDYALLAYRVLEDPDHKDKASDIEREFAERIAAPEAAAAADATTETTAATAASAEKSAAEADYETAAASAYADMTDEAFREYVLAFAEQQMPSYDSMKRGGAFYQPMRQAIEYLRANDFTVYIVSSGDLRVARSILTGPEGSELYIPESQVIRPDDLANVQPVLAFGNSQEDVVLAEKTTTGNPHKALAFMICSDDTERENGDVKQAEEMNALCKSRGWVPVSMKNDWLKIYNVGVTYLGAFDTKEAVAEETQAAEAAQTAPATQSAQATDDALGAQAADAATDPEAAGDTAEEAVQEAALEEVQQEGTAEELDVAE